MAAAGAGAGAAVQELPIGTRVKIKGLASEKGKLLNDKEGAIVDSLSDGRYGVRADNGETVRLKPANIEVAAIETYTMFKTYEDFDDHMEPGPAVKEYTTYGFKGEKPIVLYRGDRKMLPSGEVVPDAKPGAKGIPLFLGDLQSIKIYARIPPGRGNPDPRALSRYIIKGRPKLFEMSPENIQKLLKDPSVPAELRDLYFTYVKPSQFFKVDEQPPADIIEEAFGKAPEQGYPAVTPNLSSPDPTAPSVYLNRKLTDVLCKLGFDGWVVRPAKLLQRFPLRLYASAIAQYKKDFPNKLRYFYTPYPPEVMLCNWESFATWQKAVSGGRRKTRSKNRRSTRRRV